MGALLGTYTDSHVYFTNGKNAGTFNHGNIYKVGGEKIGSYDIDSIYFLNGDLAGFYSGLESGAAATFILSIYGRQKEH